MPSDTIVVKMGNQVDICLTLDHSKIPVMPVKDEADSLDVEMQ